MPTSRLPSADRQRASAPAPSDPAGREGLRLGLHRALWPEGGVGRAHQAAEGAQTLEQSAADALLGEMFWTSWIAPTEAPAECAPHSPVPLSTPG